MEHIEIVTRWHSYRDFFRGDPEVIKGQRQTYSNSVLMLTVKLGYSTRYGSPYEQGAYISHAYKLCVVPVRYLTSDTKALRYILKHTRV
jgi:hypothetical protein